MIGYFECCSCGEQWEQSGNVVSTLICPKCGNKKVNCEIGAGSPPDWYKKKEQKVKLSTLLSRFLGGKRG